MPGRIAAIAASLGVKHNVYISVRSLGEILPVTSTRVKSLWYSPPSAPQSTSRKSLVADRRVGRPWRGAAPPERPTATMLGKAARPGAELPHLRAPVRRPPAFRSSPAAASRGARQTPSRHAGSPARIWAISSLSLICAQLLDQAGRCHELDLGQLRGDLVAQADGHRVALDRQPANLGRLDDLARRPRTCSCPGGRMCEIQARAFLAQLGGVARVAEDRLAVGPKQADSCRRR